jgi:hypothetical protein
VAVPWNDISGKPNFSSDSNGDSLDIAGIVLGSAGLVFGGTALLNQSGALSGVMSGVSGALQLNPSGYSRFDDGIQLLEDGVNGITLDPAGTINAITGQFQYSRFGSASIWLSNNLMIFTSNTTSNMTLSSNSLLVQNNRDFTFSNVGACNTIFKDGNLGINTTNATSKLSISGALGINDAGIKYNITDSTFTSSTTSNTYLLRVVNENVDVNSNQHIGGLTLRNYNTAGTGNYGIPSRQLVGLGFVVRNGTSSNIEALNIKHDGNIGVGYSNPSYKLDVNGTANATTLAEGGIALTTKYSLSNTSSNYTLTSTHTTFSNWATNNFLWNSNTLSNYVEYSTYNGFANYVANDLGFKITWTSNSLSNYSTLTTFNAYSNLITPKTFWTSNALSNYSISTTNNSLFAPSNAMSNWNWASNNIYWKSVTTNCINVPNTLKVGIGFIDPALPLQVYGGVGADSFSVAGTDYTTGALPYYGIGRDSNTNAVVLSGYYGVKVQTATGCNMLEVTHGGDVTVKQSINNAYIGDFTYGTNWCGFSHKAMSNVNKYGFLHSYVGDTIVNCNSNMSLMFRRHNTTYGKYDGDEVLKTNSGIVFTQYPPDDTSINSRCWYWAIDINSKLNLYSATNKADPYGSGTQYARFDWTGGHFHVSPGAIYAEGSININYNYGYLNSAGAVGTSSGTNAYSVVAAYRIQAPEFNATSDRRIKDEINDFSSDLCLGLVNKLNVKHFRMRTDKRYKVGFIAQEVDEMFPNCVSKMPQDIKSIGFIEDFHTLDHNQIIGLLVGAVQKLSAEVDELKKKIK